MYTPLFQQLPWGPEVSHPDPESEGSRWLPHGSGGKQGWPGAAESGKRFLSDPLERSGIQTNTDSRVKVWEKSSQKTTSAKSGWLLQPSVGLNTDWSELLVQRWLTNTLVCVQISREDAQSFAQENSIHYMEASAKNRYNVEEVFMELVDIIRWSRALCGSLYFLKWFRLLLLF